MTDDGSGMSEDVRDRALEPFFTTRRAGDGSGLGLAIAASIVTGHQGTLSLRSAPDEGTEVVVEIPTAPSAPADERAPAPGEAVS